MNEIKDTKSFSINDILSWEEKGELVVSPKYQRNKVKDLFKDWKKIQFKNESDN